MLPRSLGPAFAALLPLLACQPGGELDDILLIGGLDASDPVFDAVGALASARTVGGETAYVTACTATLVAPAKVLTAKHCVLDRDPDDLHFLLGAEVAAPARVIPIASFAVEEVVRGGAIGLGSDVAVLTLAEEVEEVRPWRLAERELRASDVGRRFAAIGYGWQDNRARDGTRRLGHITLQALDGPPYPHMFADEEQFRAEFVAWLRRVLEGGGNSWDSERLTECDVNRARKTYLHPLIDRYEAFLGNADGDAQPCRGDSGGPLFTREGDDFVIHGVTSWGVALRSFFVSPLQGRESACQWGTVYATLGPEVRRLLAIELGMLEGDRDEACVFAPEFGACDGEVALRCQRPLEGRPRMTVTDCGLLGLSCRYQGDGEPTCGESTAGAEEEPDPEPPPLDCSFFGDDDLDWDGNGVIECHPCLPEDDA